MHSYEDRSKCRYIGILCDLKLACTTLAYDEGEALRPGTARIEVREWWLWLSELQVVFAFVDAVHQTFNAAKGEVFGLCLSGIVNRDVARCRPQPCLHPI